MSQISLGGGGGWHVSQCIRPVPISMPVFDICCWQDTVQLISGAFEQSVLHIRFVQPIDYNVKHRIFPNHIIYTQHGMFQHS